jgi:hypothetical protein
VLVDEMPDTHGVCDDLLCRKAPYAVAKLLKVSLFSLVAPNLNTGVMLQAVDFNY